jgi:hypothetical protein
MRLALIPILLMATQLRLPAEDPQLIGMMQNMAAALKLLQQPDFLSDEKAARSAERLGISYEDLIEYWRQQKIEKAVAISQTGKIRAMQLADAVHAANKERAEALVKSVAETCHSCHEAYREKLPNGKYRIKPEEKGRKTAGNSLQHKDRVLD